MTTRREFHGANVPSSCAGVTAIVPNSADLTTPYQVLKSRKGCCGKEVVADKRQLGKKGQEQHTSNPAPSFDPGITEIEDGCKFGVLCCLSQTQDFILFALCKASHEETKQS